MNSNKCILRRRGPIPNRPDSYHCQFITLILIEIVCIAAGRIKIDNFHLQRQLHVTTCARVLVSMAPKLKGIFRSILIYLPSSTANEQFTLITRHPNCTFTTGAAAARSITIIPRCHSPTARSCYTCVWGWLATLFNGGVCAIKVCWI